MTTSIPASGTARVPAAGTATGANGAAAAGRRTLPEDRATEFRRRWRDLQADFVDDPQQAVRSAEELAREVLDALTTRIADKQRVDGWKAGDGSGTEDLRLSVRQYRTLVDRLLEL